MIPRTAMAVLLLFISCPAFCLEDGFLTREGPWIQSSALYWSGKYMSACDSDEISASFAEESSRRRLTPQLVNVLMAMACLESGFNASNITSNSKGDSYGLMGIHWQTTGKLYVEDPKELLEIDTSIGIATTHFLRIGHKVGAYYVGDNGVKQKKNKEKAVRYEKKVRRILRSMPWVGARYGRVPEAYEKFFAFERDGTRKGSTVCN